MWHWWVEIEVTVTGRTLIEEASLRWIALFYEVQSFTSATSWTVTICELSLDWTANQQYILQHTSSLTHSKIGVQCYFIIYLCGILYILFCRILQGRFLVIDNVTHQRYEGKKNNFRVTHFICNMENMKILIGFSQNFNSIEITKGKETKKKEHLTYLKYYSRHLKFKVLAKYK